MAIYVQACVLWSPHPAIPASALRMSQKNTDIQVILTMPDSMSIERRRLLSALGAELVLTPSSEGMAGSIREAKRIAAARGGFIPDQFSNPAGPAAHYKTTGPELCMPAMAISTRLSARSVPAGTITGTGHYLKEQNPAIQIFAVEPADSPVLSGGRSGPHQLQGIGAGFVPDALDTSVYERVITVQTQEAYHAARIAAREDGVLAGISSGAALHAVSVIARSLPGKRSPYCFPIRVNATFQQRFMRSRYETE